MTTLPLFIVRPCARRPSDKRFAPYWTVIGPGLKPHRYANMENAWEQAIKQLRLAGAGVATLYSDDGKNVEWFVRRHQWPPEESWRRPEDWIQKPRQQRRANRVWSTAGTAA